MLKKITCAILRRMSGPALEALARLISGELKRRAKKKKTGTAVAAPDLNKLRQKLAKQR